MCDTTTPTAASEPVSCGCGSCSTCERDAAPVSGDTRLDAESLRALVNSLGVNFEAAVNSMLETLPTLVVAGLKLRQLELGPDGCTTTLGELRDAVPATFDNPVKFVSAALGHVAASMTGREVPTAVKFSKDRRTCCIELMIPLPEDEGAGDAGKQPDLPGIDG